MPKADRTPTTPTEYLHLSAPGYQCEGPEDEAGLPLGFDELVADAKLIRLCGLFHEVTDEIELVRARWGDMRDGYPG